MESVSSTSGNVIIGSMPVVYLLHGDPGTFSLTAKGPDMSQDEIIQCIGCNLPSSLSMEWRSSPIGSEIRPEAAVYAFSEGIAEIKQVQAVTYNVESDVIRIWTFINARNKGIQRAIYQKELSLMERFPSLIFDFNVVSDADFAGPLVPQNLRGHLSFYRTINGD